MEEITVDEFIEKIKKYYNKKIYIKLEGGIEEEIDTILDEVKNFRNNIEIIYEKTKRNFFGEKIKINIQKIEKIESDEDTEFYIYLQGEQKVIIFTDVNVWASYTLYKVANREYV